MKKLKLEIETLHVDSFEPAAGAAADTGTVRGAELTQFQTCVQSCGCPVTDRAHTCGCPDTSMNNPCFCTEWQTCWNCEES